MKKQVIVLSICLATALLAGCAGEQAVHSISGDGIYTKLAVPVGGGNSVGIVSFIGRVNDTAIVQPTSTNELHTPKVVVAVAGAGKQNVSANSGATTNAAATVAQGGRDMSVVATENGYASGGTGTNSAITISADGNK